MGEKSRILEQTKKSLKKYKEQYAALLEASSDLIFRVTSSGKFLYYKGAKKDLYVSPKKIIGQYIKDLLPKQISKKAMFCIKKAIETREIQSFEYELLMKNKIKFYEARFNATESDEVFILIRNLTKEEKIDKDIRENEAKFKALYNSSFDAIMILEPPTWKFTAGNPSTMKLFECKDEKEFTSYTPGDLSPKYQPDGKLSSIKAKKAIMEAIKKGSAFFEWTHKTAKGKIIQCTVLLTRFEKKGKPVLQATVRDITSQKEMEEYMRKLSRVVEEGPTIVIMTDAEGKIQYVNSEFTKVTGYALEEIVGKTPRILKSGKTPPEEYKKLWEEIKSGKEYKIELYNKKKDNTYYWASLSISPIKNSQGIITNFVGIQEDITKRKQIEEEINLKVKDLERFQNLVVNREIKMIELKKEINALLKKLNQKPKYKTIN